MNRVRFVASLLLFATFLIFSPRSFAAQSIPARLPLAFEPNRGQAPADVRYLLRGGVLGGEFRASDVSLTLAAGKNTVSRVRMRLVDASKSAVLEANGALEGRTNYLLGSDSARWLRNLPNYAQVRYSGIYPGIDLLFYGNRRTLEHDFELQPGADPSRIAFCLEGAESVTLGAKGDLQIKLAGGNITLNRPVAYQNVAGERHGVDAAFLVGRDGTVRFRMGRYDAAQKLIIDPTLSFATYLDRLSDGVDAVATDASGNTYITGYTFNTVFPVTPGSYSQQCAACANNTAAVYVTKLNATGTAQIYSTFLGGSAYNQPIGLAVDANGNAVVTGRTSSTDFPMKNPISAGLPSGEDGFVTSLAPDGASLNFSSLLGGTGTQGTSATTYPGAVAVDASGNVYVSGVTQSSYLPVTSGALDAGTPSYGTDDYVYLTKIQPSGNLAYSALLGDTGSASQCCYVTGVAVDSAGNAYVAGTAGVTIDSYATSTPITPWPVTSGAYQSTMISTGDTAPFVAKVSADGSKLLYSTLAGSGLTSGMALTSDNEVILAGSPGYNYPVTSNAYNSTSGTSFIAKLSADGSQLVYSSYFGKSNGIAGTSINAVSLDAAGNIWLAGSTSDSTFTLVNPLYATMPAAAIGWPRTSFLTEFDPAGAQIKFSTFMGDSSGSGLQIALDSGGMVHAAGTTVTPIYITPGAFMGAVTTAPANYEYTYPYAVLIDPSNNGATLCLGNSGGGLSFGYLLPQTTASLSVQATNCGSAPLTISSIVSSNAAFTVPTGSNTCAGSIAVGASCTVSIQFEPAAAQSYTGQLTFTSNATISTTSISLSGVGAVPVAGFGPPGVQQELVFSSLLVGQTSSAEYIGLFNNSPVPLTIDLSKITVTSGFALAAGGSCPATLPANQHCWISVVFAPASAGTITGTLSVTTNDPVHPTISTTLSGTAFDSYPVATITGLLNPSYPINSGTTPITMSVDGTNFFPASVVYINGTAQTTTYQSSSFLTVTFSPSLLTAVGQLPVTVVNPTPGGGSSAPYPLIEFLSIPLTASALTIDPAGGLLYAAIPTSAAQNPDTVIPINPATGATMTPLPVASGPRALAVSEDGSELYVASAGVLQRFNLKTLTLEKTFNLPVDSMWGQTYVQEMHVVPGSPQSIVVELFANVDPAEDGMALYNDSGLVNWIPGQSLVNGGNSIFWPDSFTFTTASNLYAIGQYGESFFYTLQNSTNGLTLTGGGNPTASAPMVSGHLVRSDGTLLYTNTGQVWDPSSQKLLGTYLAADGNPLFDAAGIIPEPSSGHTYALDGASLYDDYQAVSIDVYDQASYALLGTVPFTSIYPPDATDLVRWGSNGFAFRTVDITGSQPSANQIVIATSDLIAPSNGTPVPILASVSPSLVYAGGPAYTMQLTGSGFTSASTVLVNGNPRSTTYISGVSLTAQVLASDIATSGQFEVQVSTPAPGGGTSNYVIVSLQIATPNPTLSSGLLSFPQGLEGVVSAPQTVQLSNLGSAPLSITSIAAGGDFSTTNNCPSSLAVSASCTISVTVTPSAAGNITGTLTITDNAYTVTQTLSLQGSGEAPFTFAAATGGSTAASVSGGAAASYNLQLTGASGLSGTVSLSCSGAPANANCTISPSTLTIASGGTGSFTVTVTTQTTTTAAIMIHSPVALAGLGVLSLLTLPWFARKHGRKLLPICLLCIVALSFALGLASCGGSGSAGGGSKTITSNTPPGSYTLTVTASNGAAKASQSLTLTVN